MPNNALFSSSSQTSPSGVRASDARNEAGGRAYALSPKEGLAQYALTGTLHHTYYASDTEQLAKVLEFADKCDPEFVAKTAVYARQRGYMKDMPALLLAYLAAKSTEHMKTAFPRVIDNSKMLRNFVQMIRSGQLGRKSLGTAPKRLVQSYLNSLTDEQLFRAEVGNSPTLEDIIRMVRPCPTTLSRSALQAHLLGRKEFTFNGTTGLTDSALPKVVRDYEEFKAKLLSTSLTDSEKSALYVPDVPFQMLTALPLTKEHWKFLALRMTWTQVRKNINTLQRHGVYEDAALTKMLAAKLSSKEEIQKAKVFPYELFAAAQALTSEVPGIMKAALSDAADIAVDNVPSLEGLAVACLDISGSMDSPITGYRKAQSKVSCRQVAALVGAAILRKNASALLIPFTDDVVMPASHGVTLNPRDSILTNAEKLARLPSGGTNCSSPLKYLNQKGIRPDFIWMVSDNQSWVDYENSVGSRAATGLMQQFDLLKKSNPNTKMVLNDITPYSTSQGYERDDILRVGSFSDLVFEISADFSRSERQSLVQDIESISL